MKLLLIVVQQQSATVGGKHVAIPDTVANEPWGECRRAIGGVSKKELEAMVSVHSHFRGSGQSGIGKRQEESACRIRPAVFSLKPPAVPLLVDDSCSSVDQSLPAVAESRQIVGQIGVPRPGVRVYPRSQPLCQIQRLVQ